jgi:hypothetical protein
MIIVVLATIVFIGLMLWLFFEIDEVYSNKKQKMVKRIGFKYVDEFEISVAILFAIIYLAISLPALIIQVNADHWYDKTVMQREILIIRLQELKDLEDDVSFLPSHKYQIMAELYEDIYEFNSKILYAQEYEDNIFIGWYISPRIARLNIIDLNGDFTI